MLLCLAWAPKAEVRKPQLSVHDQSSKVIAIPLTYRKGGLAKTDNARPIAEIVESL